MLKMYSKFFTVNESEIDNPARPGLNVSREKIANTVAAKVI